MRWCAVADVPYRVELRRAAIGGPLTLRWEIYQGAELVTSSIKVYSTEMEASADAVEQIARLLRPPPGPDRF